MGENISVDIAVIAYQAGQSLQFNLSLTAPAQGKYYVLGALYTSGGTYISGTLFGLLVLEGVGIPSTWDISLWSLEKGENAQIPCAFTLNRSDVTLALFALRMVGGTPSLDGDEQVESVTVSLVSSAPPMSIMDTLGLVAVVGIATIGLVRILKK